MIYLNVIRHCFMASIFTLNYLLLIFNQPFFSSMTNQQKIIPYLWFARNAVEAANFYVSVFPDSKVNQVDKIPGTPSGDIETVSFELWGNPFIAMSAGNRFQFNDSISFYVYCGSATEIEQFYQVLMTGGSVVMPLDKYPWSSKYAWIKDRFGLSWQLDIDAINSSQKIVPSLLFVNDKMSKVRAASSFYRSVFKDTQVILEAPYDPSANLPAGTLLFTQFKLNGQLFNAMSSTLTHDFDFNEAISFMIYCDTQAEIDYYWDKLTLAGMEQPCGWLKDQFGVSWQVVPKVLDNMLATKDKVKLEKVMHALLEMKKINISNLLKAIEIN